MGSVYPCILAACIVKCIPSHGFERSAVYVKNTKYDLPFSLFLKIGVLQGLCLVPVCWGRENAHPPLEELCSGMTSAEQAIVEAVTRGWCIGKTSRGWMIYTYCRFGHLVCGYKANT